MSALSRTSGIYSLIIIIMLMFGYASVAAEVNLALVAEGRIHPEVFAMLSRGEIAEGREASDFVAAIELELGRAVDVEQRRRLTWALYLIPGRHPGRSRVTTRTWQGEAFGEVVTAIFPVPADLGPINPVEHAPALEELIRDGSALLANSIAVASPAELIALLLAVQRAAAPEPLLADPLIEALALRLDDLIGGPSIEDHQLLVEHALLAAARGALSPAVAASLVDQVLSDPALAAESLSPLVAIAAIGGLGNATHDRLLALALATEGGGRDRLLSAVQPSVGAATAAASAIIDVACRRPDPSSLGPLAAIAGNSAFRGSAGGERIQRLLTLAQNEDDFTARTALASVLGLGGAATSAALVEAAPRLIALHGSKGVDPGKGEKRDPDLRGELLLLAFLPTPPISPQHVPEIIALLNATKPNFRASFNCPALFSLAWRASPRPRNIIVSIMPLPPELWGPSKRILPAYGERFFIDWAAESGSDPAEAIRATMLMSPLTSLLLAAEHPRWVEATATATLALTSLSVVPVRDPATERRILVALAKHAPTFADLPGLSAWVAARSEDAVLAAPAASTLAALGDHSAAKAALSRARAEAGDRWTAAVEAAIRVDPEGARISAYRHALKRSDHRAAPFALWLLSRRLGEQSGPLPLASYDALLSHPDWEGLLDALIAGGSRLATDAPSLRRLEVVLSPGAQPARLAALLGAIDRLDWIRTQAPLNPAP